MNGPVLAVFSVIVALVVVGVIFYLARELTSKENLPDSPRETDGED